MKKPWTSKCFILDWVEHEWFSFVGKVCNRHLWHLQKELGQLLQFRVMDEEITEFENKNILVFSSHSRLCSYLHQVPCLFCLAFIIQKPSIISIAWEGKFHTPTEFYCSFSPVFSPIVTSFSIIMNNSPREQPRRAEHADELSRAWTLPVLLSFCAFICSSESQAKPVSLPSHTYSLQKI